MADKRNLQIVIDAQNNATKELQRVTGETKNMTASVFKGVASWDLLKEGVRRASAEYRNIINATVEMENSMIGLQTVARAFGQDVDATTQSAIALSQDGLMSVNESASGLKNLLASGFSLPEATELMNAFKDSASFNRQGMLGFGEAIVGATQGIKNQNSIMVDNAGITKNLSIILKEAGYSSQDLGNVTSDTGVRMALFNGILREASAFAGDASRASQTLGGAQDKLKTSVFNLRSAIGGSLAPTVKAITIELTKLANKVTEFVIKNQETIAVTLKVIATMTAVIGSFILFNKVIGLSTIAVKALHMAITFMTAHPVVLFFTAIAGSVIYLSTKMGGLKNAFASIGFGIIILGNVVAGSFKEMGNLMISFINSAISAGNGVYNFFAKMLNKIGMDIELSPMTNIEFKFDTEGNMARINESLDMISSISGEAKRAEDAVTATSDAIGAIPPPPPSAPEGVGELADKYEELQEKIKDTSDKSIDAFSDMASKVDEITRKISELFVGKAKDDLSVKQEYAQAYVEQEQKVAELRERIGEETDFAKRKLLEAELLREQEALQKKKTIEIAYHNEVAEARRRASLTDFERITEDLENKKTLMDQEFEYKKTQLENELGQELKKLSKMAQINEVMLQMIDKVNAQREKMTVDSINREIDKWNSLARAIQRAKEGKTTGSVGVSSAVTSRANQQVGAVNVSVTGNTISSESDAQILAQKVKEEIMKALSFNTKLSL